LYQTIRIQKVVLEIPSYKSSPVLYINALLACKRHKAKTRGKREH